MEGKRAEVAVVDKTDMEPLPLLQDTAPLKMTSHHMEEEEVEEKAKEAASLVELEASSVEKKEATVEAAVDSLAASVEASLAERKIRVAEEEEEAMVLPLPLPLDTAPLKMTSLPMEEVGAKEAKKVVASLVALEVICQLKPKEF